MRESFEALRGSRTPRGCAVRRSRASAETIRSAPRLGPRLPCEVLNPPGTARIRRDARCTARSRTCRFAGTFGDSDDYPGSLKIVVSPVRVWVSPFLKNPACGLVLGRLWWRLEGVLQGRFCARGPFQVLNLRVVEGLAVATVLCSRLSGRAGASRSGHATTGTRALAVGRNQERGGAYRTPPKRASRWAAQGRTWLSAALKPPLRSGRLRADGAYCGLVSTSNACNFARSSPRALRPGNVVRVP
jgi:hypothetical protein